MIHRTPFFLPWLYPTLTWRMPAHDQTLYLTFDDGPVPGPTEFVLDTLREHDAKATFFCIGDNVRKHPHIFRKILDDGHAVGNHTFNHVNGWKYPVQYYIDNLKRCETQLQGEMTVPVSRLFRPPYGRITRKQIRALADYRIIMWDVLSVDYDRSLDAQACLRRTVKATRPGSIIVFHDSLKAEKNLVYVLPKLLTHFRAAGFQFKSIPG